ncbi:MAG: glutamate--tRNA ligase [Deltaproteobacteria bacterium]|nr:glutamate--tRNA ligase [Deltaproteobacteria bacterium]
MTDGKLRVRFAPSPTGFMHIGNARTAVVNWLYARRHGGTFVLRIEDTDRERSTQEAVQVIYDSLRWLGLDWDEGPYLQSERFELYRRRAEELVERGLAYRCWCTPDELEERRKQALAEKRNPKYDGRCRTRTEPREGVRPVIRFRMPETGTTAIQDLIQGEVVTANEELDDLVLRRADGAPTYNFTVVIDDHDMAITHVVRGADHLSNTFRQVQIYRAFGWDTPAFGHLSLILGPDRTKLSKRHGAVSVLQYRDDGYLPEAMVNALTRLGWSHGDEEVFTVEELVRLFDLPDVGKAPAIFDFEKLRNKYNAEHVRRADPGRMGGLLAATLERLGIARLTADDPRLALLTGGLRERSRTLVEMAEASRPLLVEDVAFDEAAVKKHLKADAADVLRALGERIAALAGFERPALARAIEELAAARGIGMGKVAQPARVALTGTAVSPPIDVVMAVLGREQVLRRLEAGARKAAG